MNYASYDAMGRVTGSNEEQASQFYSFAYSYNVSGTLKSETYPSGRVITPGYDGANRVGIVSGSYSGATTNYVRQPGASNNWVVYAPHGAPQNYTY